MTQQMVLIWTPVSCQQSLQHTCFGGRVYELHLRYQNQLTPHVSAGRVAVYALMCIQVCVCMGFVISFLKSSL